ncbi:MAG: hypothetical protein M3033_14450 [Acidobacteriota bacterium]|nr:hypothetical protein [Acidobacteriota bacterium]
MNAEQITTIITNLLTSGGISVFFWFLVRSLKLEISGLNATVKAQKETLEVMEKRISETEKVGDIYKNLIKELPEHVEQYKIFINRIKDEKITELEKVSQSKNTELHNNTLDELKKILLQEQFIDELSTRLNLQSKPLKTRPLSEVMKEYAVSFVDVSGKESILPIKHKPEGK